MSNEKWPHHPSKRIYLERLRARMLEPLHSATDSLEHLYESREWQPVGQAARLGKIALDRTYEVIEKPISHKLLFQSCLALAQRSDMREQPLSVETESFGRILLTQNVMPRCKYYELNWSTRPEEYFISSHEGEYKYRIVEFDARKAMINERLHAFEHSQRFGYVERYDGNETEIQPECTNVTVNKLTTQRALQLAVSLRNAIEE